MTNLKLSNSDNLYLAVTRYKGELWSEGCKGIGHTSDEIIELILDGDIADLEAVICIWGQCAGSDMTEIIRGQCLQNVRWADVNDGDTPCNFITAHKDYDACYNEWLKDARDEAAQERTERTY